MSSYVNRIVRRGLCFLMVLLLTAGAAFPLTACHGKTGMKEFTIPETFDTDKEIEISFWAKNDTNKTQTAIYEKAIADFETLYPNITVNLRLYTDYGKIYNDVITNIATGTTPNVCITYPDHIATYLTGDNLVVPLEELLRDPVFGAGGSEVRFDAPALGEIDPKFLAECDFAGHIYALPYMRSTEACYVNQTYVEALGYHLPEQLTWDFIWEVSAKAMEKDASGNFAVNGQKVMIPFIYKSTDNMMIQMLAQKEAGYSTKEGEIRIFNDTTKEILKEVAQYGGEEVFSTFKISSYPANFLNAGQCIFAIDSTAGATWMGSDAPLCDISPDKIVKFETAVRAIPQYDPANPKMISQGPSVCIFNKPDGDTVLASWLFTQFLLTNEVQISYAQTEGYVPVTLKARETQEYKDYLSAAGTDSDLHYRVKLDATKLLLDNVDNTFVTPVFNGSASLRDAAGQLVENSVKAARRGKVVDDAYVDTLYEDVSSLYRLNQSGLQNTSSFGKKELGPLPGGAVALLGVLGGTWLILISVGAMQWYRNKKQNKNT